MATISHALQTALQHHQAGRLDLAEEIYRRILEVEPDHAEALHLFGLVAHQRGRHQAAIEHLAHAVEIDPRQAHFHNNLGEAYRVLGRLDEAVVCYRRALTLLPDYTDAHNNLGEALRISRKLDEAVACYRRALEVRPGFAEAHNNLGIALEEQGQIDDAVACYRRAIQWKPDLAAAHNNLGSTLQRLGEFDEALQCYQRALSLNPEYAGAYNNLGTALRDQGRLAEAIACFERALRLRPDLAMAYSNYLCALRCDPAVTPAELAEAHAQFDRTYAVRWRAAWQPHANSREPERRLRLGFVSPAFGLGPIGSFLIRALEHLDPSRGEIHCYSDRTGADELTSRFQAASHGWYPTAAMTDEELAAQIRRDQIDILFDLTGHAPRNRLLTFARKPAPVQITWIDSVGTSGLSAIDYVLADRQLIPPEAETHYAERVLRMPDSYVCYEPPRAAPGVGPLPASERDHVTFGSFNQPTKIHRQVVQVWSQILLRTPGSRLLLKYRGLASPLAAGHYRQLFQAEGVDPACLEFEGHSPLKGYLASYNRVDIALDPFPHCGGLTTCDSLWMGVPVVTCPGETFASRQSLSHLSTIGLTETIARDTDQYVEIAVRLASDLPRLAEIRSRLREQMAISPLCDGKRFAESLLALLRDVWRRWAQSEGA